MEKNVFQIPFKVIKQYQKFNRSQRISRDELRDWQDNQLKSLVIHAGKNVPYYRTIFREVNLNPNSFRGQEDLHRIPLLDKETVRINSKFLIADNAKKYGITWDSTSGSTGTPLNFILSNQVQAAKIAALLRSYKWAGYKPGKKMFSLQSYYYKDVDYTINRLYNVMRFDSNRLNRDSALNVMKKLFEFKPEFFMGFPFDIMMMGKLNQEAGKEIYQPKAIITYGETLSPYRRESLEKLYNCKVYNFHSMHECAAMISQCEEGNLHLVDDFSYHELIEKDNVTKLVGTSYYNYAMPLLRYEINDIIVPEVESKKCKCNRPFPVIRDIQGKACDYLETPDGRYLGAVMSHSIDKAKGVVSSQCVQHNINEIEVNIITDKGFDSYSETELLFGLRKRVGTDVRVRINKVDELEKRPSGKTPFIISHLGNEFR